MNILTKALAAVLIGASAQAATIEFDVSGLTFEDTLNGVAPYQLNGDTTFLFDTESLEITGVAFDSPETGVTYDAGTWDAGEMEFTSAGTTKINFDPFVLLSTLDALMVGESVTGFPAGDESDRLGPRFFAFVNGNVTATRLPDMAQVPAPGGFVLLLSSLVFLRRRRAQ